MIVAITSSTMREGTPMTPTLIRKMPSQTKCKKPIRAFKTSEGIHMTSILADKMQEKICSAEIYSDQLGILHTTLGQIL